VINIPTAGPDIGRELAEAPNRRVAREINTAHFPHSGVVREGAEGTAAELKGLCGGTRRLGRDGASESEGASCGKSVYLVHFDCVAAPLIGKDVGEFTEDNLLIMIVLYCHEEMSCGGE
jgi:hypothetical protein